MLELNCRLKIFIQGLILLECSPDTTFLKRFSRSYGPLTLPVKLGKTCTAAKGCVVVSDVEEVEGCADEVLEVLSFWSGDMRLGKGNIWVSSACRRAQTQQRPGEGRSH